ncbi:hypothetical protein Glove_382g64 [Diversispora epigaea]|uniref:Crinkler effector protein N-terminal domain-containing protein n=1 Tax=Diversispora epigaea TaxID=1348612 RepID=A0A397H8X0_9GLOM|nr:hypothetical protein Glove_382g64 [Diversispora epigaea]
MNPITLNCLVEKDNPRENCFMVKINQTETVSDLKELIKDKTKNTFVTIDANQLKLWKVNVSLLESNEKLNVLIEREPAMIEQKLMGNKLLATKKVSNYFNEQPAEEHIHIIVEFLPVPTITSDREKELLNEIFSLKELFTKSINEISLLKTQFFKSEHMFEVTVPPKRTDKLIWTVNINNVGLNDLKKAMYNKYKTPALENEYTVVVLDFIIDKTPSKPFADWTLPQVCRLYGLTDENGDTSIDRFPKFICGYKELNDRPSKEIFKTLMNNLNLFYKYTRIHNNEASKSLFVYLYLVAGTSLHDDQYVIEPQFNIQGHNGHGPVDYAIRSCETSKIVSVTKVNHQKFEKGIAQNAVQIESALSNRKRKFNDVENTSIFRNRVIGIITDATTWYFLECFYDNQEKPSFKLSDSTFINYKNKMEDDVKKVLGHISWLLEEAQKPVDLKSERPVLKKLKSST